MIIISKKRILVVGCAFSVLGMFVGSSSAHADWIARNIGGVREGGVRDVAVSTLADTDNAREPTKCEKQRDTIAERNYFEIELWRVKDGKAWGSIGGDAGSDGRMVFEMGPDSFGDKGLLPLGVLDNNKIEVRATLDPANRREGRPCSPILTLNMDFVDAFYYNLLTREFLRFDAGNIGDMQNVTFSRTSDKLVAATGGGYRQGSNFEKGTLLFTGDVYMDSGKTFYDMLPRISKNARQGFYVFDYVLKTTGQGQSTEHENRKIRFILAYDLEAVQGLPIDPKEREKETGEFIDDVIETKKAGGEISGSILYNMRQFFGLPAVSCPEDVNHDGNINIIDLVTIARSFGQRNPIQRIAGNTAPLTPEDVNGDDVVNIIDLVTVARRFGQRCDAGAYISPSEEQVVFIPVPVTKQSQSTGFASVLKSIFWVIGN